MLFTHFRSRLSWELVPENWSRQVRTMEGYPTEKDMLHCNGCGRWFMRIGRNVRMSLITNVSKGRRGDKLMKKWIVMLTLLCLCSLLVMPNTAQAQALSKGMQSEHVLKLQEQLHALGYFHAGFTGYFGVKTEAAVKQFQRDHRLTADGVVGSATQAKMDSYGEVKQTVLEQLARIIHGEARGESFEGQVAVGAVVLNRVQSDLFPSSIPDVILQPRQFTAVQDGQYRLAPNQSAYRAARQALNGVDPTNGSLFYYNPAIATSEWSINRPAVMSLGRHTFTN